MLNQGVEHICPMCRQPLPNVCENKLDDMCMSLLLKIWQGVIEFGHNRVNLKNLDITYGTRSKITQLRYLGLVAMVKNEKGKHVPATWLITSRASDFLHGRKAIHKYAWSTKGHTIPREEVKGRTPLATDIKLNRLVTRGDYKILKDFSASYEISNDNLIKIEVKQMALSL
jgi:hypothetical protein